jgi:hypothetical protein
MQAEVDKGKGEWKHPTVNPLTPASRVVKSLLVSRGKGSMDIQPDRRSHGSLVSLPGKLAPPVEERRGAGAADHSTSCSSERNRASFVVCIRP